MYVTIAVMMIAAYGSYIYFAATGGSPDELTIAESQAIGGIYPLGKTANSSFYNYTSAKEVENTSSGYLTVTASAIKETGMYMRKGWVSSTIDVKKRSGRRRTRNVKTKIPTYSNFSIFHREYMVPIYAITLSDGGEVGAVISSKYVSALEDGETITLPVGRRVKMGPNTVAYFAKVGNGETQFNSIYYALDDEWYTENASSIKTMAVVYAVLIFVGLITLLIVFGKKLLATDD